MDEMKNRKINYTSASFLKRLGAFIIDGFILSSLTALIMKINPNLLIVVSFTYFILLDGSKYQGTYGKQLFGLKVVDTNGQRLSYLHATIRHIVKYFGIMFLGIGYAGLPFRITNHKALVDTISKARVVEYKI